MKDPLSPKINLFGAWSLVFYTVAVFLGWWVVAPFFPLVSPAAGIDQVVALTRDNVLRIRLGMVLLMWGSAFFIPFTASVADYVSRIERREGPLSRIVTLAGYSNALLTFYPALWWITSTWRVETRSPELTYLLSDIAWIQFMGAVSLFMPMFIAVAVAALNDKSASPVYPRWFAFLSFFLFALMMPEQMLFFFKTGPFSWTGLIGFWIPVPGFFLWMLLTFYFTRRGALRDIQESQR